MSFNFITAAEAASYIKDGDIVGLSGRNPARIDLPQRICRHDSR